MIKPKHAFLISLIALSTSLPSCRNDGEAEEEAAAKKNSKNEIEAAKQAAKETSLRKMKEVSWKPSEEASYYNVIIYEDNCRQEIVRYEGVTSTAIGVDTKLSFGDVCIKVFVKDDSNETVDEAEYITDLNDKTEVWVYIENFQNGDNDIKDLKTLPMKFERKYYQTRSIKRIMMTSKTTDMDKETTKTDKLFLKEGTPSKVLINNNEHQCIVQNILTLSTYTRFTPVEQNTLMETLHYGINNVKISLQAENIDPNQTTAVIEIYDFDIMSPSASSLQTETSEGHEFQGWINMGVSGTVYSDETSLTTGYENMINY